VHQWVHGFGARVVALTLLLGGCVASAGVTPTPLPFDATLSIYVGHSGTWYNCNAGKDETAEIEDPVAAFEATETFSEDVEVWADHQINDPPIPTGWLFFSPVVEAEMTLHVVVRDTQSRLGDVVVRDRDTWQIVGVLPANEAGSQIDGMLVVDPSAEAYSLEVRGQPHSNLLCHAAANNPRVEQAFVFSQLYGWTPSCGGDHQGGQCPGDPLHLPAGDPRATEGKTVVDVGPVPSINGCAGPKEYTNDTQEQVSISPLYPLQDKELLKDIAFPIGNLSPEAATAIGAKIDAARQAYQAGHAVLQSYTVKPFARVKVHWPVSLTGGATAVLYVPYRGRTTNRVTVEANIAGKVNEEWGAGSGAADPADAVVLSLTAKWGPGEKRMACLPPVKVGTLWGLTCSATAAPGVTLEEGITSDVTFELHVNVPPGLNDGEGLVEPGQAWTTPAPPGPSPMARALTFPGDGEPLGHCTVQLRKGWKWQAKGKPANMGGEDDVYGEGTVPFFDAPPESNVSIVCPFVKLLVLKVKAVLNQGGATESVIEMERQDGTNWVPAGGGDTVQEGNDQIWTHMGPVGPGTYRVRGRTNNPEGAWGAWVEFGVVPAVELTKTVTVPQPGN
jgi:hypothetical protein